MRPMTEQERQSAHNAILKLVDGYAWSYVCIVLEDQLAHDMLVAKDVLEREAVAAEYRLMEKFLNTLTNVANQVRGQ